jgi:hypothetical protein
MTQLLKPLFPLGQVVATPGALDALGGEGIRADALLQRHAIGDWGEVCEDDKRENDLSVTEGFRILSAYTLPKTQVKLWIITEADRSATALLLPDDY